MNNVVVLHGIDHKVGTTMIAQSVAEIISEEKKGYKVLLLFLNGRKSTDYVREEFDSIGHIKMQIDNRIITGKEMIKACRCHNNLYMLAGIDKPEEERYYYPDTAEYVLNALKSEFDLILVDSGNTLDNGLALGSLKFCSSRLLVLTQQETMLKRYEELLPLYEKLGLDFSSLIINKFSSQDPYDLGYLSIRLDTLKSKIRRVEMTNSARQAEMEYKTLLAFQDEKYTRDVLAIANLILIMTEKDQILKSKRGIKWKNFI